VDASGHWTYTLNSGVPAVQALGATGTLTDTFVVASGDGSQTQTVTVTIHGTNDVPVISGVVTGAVTEDIRATASGTLTSVDADTGQSNTFLAGSGSGANSHGTYTVTAGGCGPTRSTARMAAGAGAGRRRHADRTRSL